MSDEVDSIPQTLTEAATQVLKKCFQHLRLLNINLPLDFRIRSTRSIFEAQIHPGGLRCCPHRYQSR